MDQAELLRHVVTALRSVVVPYAVTGAQASIMYGEARFTNDIDVVAALTPELLARFLAHFPAEQFYVSADAATEAVKSGGQFNIIHPSSAQKVDVIIASQEFDRLLLRRARELRVTPDMSALFIAPEDLILKKMDFYREGGSEKHLRDISGMLAISRQTIDGAEIEHRAVEMGLLDVWQAVLRRVNEG